MNLAILFSMLLQSGACAPVNFAGPDGSELTVLVCPMLRVSPSEPPPASEPAPAAPLGKKT
jgi:hypothetical protein